MNRHPLATLLPSLLLVLGGCSPPPAPLAHDAYIWQRVWRPALAAAMRDSADVVRQWRVLAAEAQPGGALLPVAVDWQALRASGRPAVMVVRIDGQLPGLDQGALLAGISALRRDWAAAGVVPAGLEIDHDCATARLGAYAGWLTKVRHSLGGALPLSITALPAWLDAAELDRVLAEADEAVLQVHAVRNPSGGLFDAGLARAWIARFAARSRVPFRVALPAYGARVDFDRFGNPAAVESEAPLLASVPDSRELAVDPAAVAALLASLRGDAPPGLRGIVWFRLPTAEDRRAWSLSTWRAVVEGRSLVPRFGARLRAAESPGLYDLVLENRGDVDTPWPRIEVGPGCAAADAIAGYALRSGASGQVFRPIRSGLLPARGRVAVGWLRCASERVVVHVAP